ncbi:MAG: hypothetical protein ACR2JU_03140 [Nocardioidaceae bacterium]
MVIRPGGYSLWERMQREVDDRIKAAGAQNANFPLFIPQAYLQREVERLVTVSSIKARRGQCVTERVRSVLYFGVVGQCSHGCAVSWTASPADVQQ